MSKNRSFLRLIVIGFVLCFVLTLVASAESFLNGSFFMPVEVCTPPPANMVAWYRGENNASDQTGANPGTLVNGPTFPAGKVNNAFGLAPNGAYPNGSYVSVPDSASLKPTSVTV